MNWAGELLTLGLVWPGRLDADAGPWRSGGRGAVNDEARLGAGVVLLMQGRSRGGGQGTGDREKSSGEQGEGGGEVLGVRIWPGMGLDSVGLEEAV